jgi:hypothetical protein
MGGPGGGYRGTDHFPVGKGTGVGRPPNVWIELLTNGQQSTDSIRAGRVFDQAEGRPPSRRAIMARRGRAGSPSGAVRSADLLGVFGLQVVGSGLAPQHALRAPSGHGPYSVNCRKVHRPPVPGSERSGGKRGWAGQAASSAVDPSASRLPPAHIPTG